MANLTRYNFPRPLITAVLAALLTGLCYQTMLAQATDAKPIARLIAATSGDHYSRTSLAGSGANLVISIDTTHVAKAFPSAIEASSIERRAFDLTNEARQRNQLAMLVWDEELCRMARLHSERMARLGFFSHVTPEGQRLRDRAQATGIRFRVIAENIAYNQGYDDPGAFAVERWLVSPGHRANILDSVFQAGAVGVYVASDGTVFLTEAFITR